MVKLLLLLRLPALRLLPPILALLPFLFLHGECAKGQGNGKSLWRG